MVVVMRFLAGLARIIADGHDRRSLAPLVQAAIARLSSIVRVPARGPPCAPITNTTQERFRVQAIFDTLMGPGSLASPLARGERTLATIGTHSGRSEVAAKTISAVRQLGWKFLYCSLSEQRSTNLDLPRPTYVGIVRPL